MTSRSDITVLYQLDPRLILVAKPSSEVTMQDLHDTLMDIDDEPANMIYPHLVESAGKEDLGGGVKVGITLTLQNAQVAFERRETVKAQGTITTDSVPGSVSQHIIDTSATFITDGIERGDLVSNSTDISACEVIDVLSETDLLVLSPGAGLTSDFTTGDNYQIWETETCNFSGGNLVAVDPDGNTIEALFPTYCVTAKVTASSAATLQNTAQLEYGTFGGGVHVNLTSSYSGTNYPTGTPQQPVNNFSDALDIEAERGFGKLFIYGDATFGTGLDFSGLIIEGESPTKSTFTITAGADVTETEFTNATVTGTLDGGNVLTDCSLLTITYVEGIIQRCLLLETVTLSGAATAFFLDCWSGVPGSQTPTINMGGSGSELAVRNYSGGLKLTNRSGTDACSIDMNSGQIVIDNTVTAGTITLRGVAKWTNEKTYVGGATIQSELITFQDTQQLAFEDKRVEIDADSSYSGTAYPRGTARMPVNNFNDALVIASGQGLDGFHVKGTISIPSGTDVSAYSIMGHGANVTVLNVEDGSDTSQTSFENLTMYGYLSGQNIVRDSVVMDTENFYGVIHQSMIAGEVGCGMGASNFLSCYQAPDILGSGIIKPQNSIGANIQDWIGALIIGEKTSTNEIIVSIQGDVTVLDAAASGSILLQGIGEWDNQYTYAGTAEVVNHLISQQSISDLAGTIITTGYTVSSIANAITLADTASTVNGAYDPARVAILEGAGAGQTRLIYQYDGTTKTAYVDRNWKVNPDTTSKYAILVDPGREHINEGVLQGATANTATLNANASDVDHVYAHQLLFLRGGTGEDQIGLITEYDGTTKVATVFEDWFVQPSDDTTYVIIPNHIHHTVDANILQVSGVPVSIADFGGSPTAVADAVWDQVMDAGYTAEETMKIMLSSLAGKLSGAAGTTITIRDVNDTKPRITAVVDEDGNRLSVTLDGS